MSNRRKSREERTGQRGYGRKVWKSRGAPMFKDFPAFDFEIAKPRSTGEQAPPRRALSGKDRVRARRGKR